MILVLFAQVISKGVDEPVLLCSLTRTFTACNHNVGLLIKANADIKVSSLTR